MALSSSVLSTALRAAFVADIEDENVVGALDGAALTALCDIIAAAVVDHIVAAAVTSTITTCPAGAGTGVGGVT